MDQKELVWQISQLANDIDELWVLQELLDVIVEQVKQRKFNDKFGDRLEVLLDCYQEKNRACLDKLRERSIRVSSEASKPISNGRHQS
jgi:hypothetical protein